MVHVKSLFKIILLLIVVAFFSYGIKVWYVEMYNGTVSLPGKVIKHINKEVPIKHGTNTEFHLLVDFGQYGKHDLNVTTACYFDCVDGTTYYWKKNPRQLNGTLQNGWTFIGFIGLLIVGVIGIVIIVKFLSWVFDIKWE